MKRKIITSREEGIIGQAKDGTAEKGRRRKVPSPKQLEKSYRAFCGQPMGISKGQLRDILKEDPWDK